ncbi:MAG: four helix bundle protein [Verrucomicrobiae bacterium]|nr:four helix bundle protein [Verrucomicrobiae bacterium]
MNAQQLKDRTQQFAIRIMKMADALPRTTSGRILADQIIRSATATAAGYRAACRARSRPDWIDKIGRVIEEADETLLWLELIEQTNLLPASRLVALKQEAHELTALFTAIHKSSKRLTHTDVPPATIQNQKSQIRNQK